MKKMSAVLTAHCVSLQVLFSSPWPQKVKLAHGVGLASSCLQQVHLVFAALTPYLERVLALLSKKTILSYNKALR